MSSEKELKLVKEAINKISKEDLVRFILDNKKISKEELLNLMQQSLEQVPLSIFTTKLHPLEAITRFMKEKARKRTNEIACILNKRPSSISEAYKNSRTKKFKIKKTGIFIPLSEFKSNPKLSILEVVVQYLRNKNLKFTEIAELLKRNPKTIWTVYNRAKKKNVR